MKVAILFCILSLAVAAPEKKFVLDQLTGLFSADQLKTDLQLLLDTLGSDPTEQACEGKCHQYITDALLTTSCPLLCHSFQELVHYFQLTPDVTTTVTIV